MADRQYSSPLSPSPRYRERTGPVYEREFGRNIARRGPLRFEEGLATNTDLPTEFQTGIRQGYVTPPGRPNRNMNVYEKPAELTMRERAHLGSAAWVEAPLFLQEFAFGTSNPGHYEYQQVDRSGGRYERLNPACIPD